MQNTSAFVQTDCSRMLLPGAFCKQLAHRKTWFLWCRFKNVWEITVRGDNDLFFSLIESYLFDLAFAYRKKKNKTKGPKINIVTKRVKNVRKEMIKMNFSVVKIELASIQ